MSMYARMAGSGRNADYDHGLRFFDQGLYEQAIAELEKVDAPVSGADAFTRRLAVFYIAESCVQLGASAMQNGRPELAKRYLARAIGQNPHYPDLHFQHGLACLELRDAPGACDSFGEALRLNPRYAKARLYHAIALYAAGDAESAGAEAQTALGSDAAYGGEGFQRSRKAHEAGDFETARLHLLDLARAQMDDMSYHVKLGEDFYRRGMYEQSAEEYRRALDINGGYADVRNALGVTYYALGRLAEAAGEFESALAINPKYADARANHALVLSALGRADESAAQKSVVLELDPDHPIAQQGAVGWGGA